jgi:hypothetical protein
VFELEFDNNNNSVYEDRLRNLLPIAEKPKENNNWPRGNDRLYSLSRK